MIKHFSKAMNVYALSHIAMLLLYFILLTFLKAKDGDPLEVAKQMFAAFTIVNIFVFYFSNQSNNEKREGKQISKECILYGLIFCEILAFAAAFLIFHVAI